MTDITVRLAGTNDAVLIADMSRQNFYETFAWQNTKENMWLKPSLSVSTKIHLLLSP